MPIVHIYIMEGRDTDKKRKLVKKVTEAICDSIDSPKEAVKIVISEMKKEHYAIAGELILDKS